jgi:hypothetical protein
MFGCNEWRQTVALKFLYFQKPLPFACSASVSTDVAVGIKLK